ncbi:hypothetical protein [Streptomyces sp. NPDC089919]|uniref:hypothetical protein n=1 Tax=Streptomyces sp. NPDC089919 TaxID=3155188 RepID=UPI0034279473
MNREREQALAALRQWSVPGRRAELVAAAWGAGATVVAIAEAARAKSRQTIYDDLRSQGIDPRSRPKESTVITDLSPLDIEGFTGNGESADAEFQAAMLRWIAEHPTFDKRGQEVQTEGMRLVALMDTTVRYADVRDLLAHEQVARSARDRLLHQVELRWEALSTAASWLAAHHAYVLAVDEARIGVDMWCERAEAAINRPFYCSTERDEAAYRQIQDAGHPALEQHQADLDRTPAQTAERLRAHLDQAHERRTELAAQTMPLAQAAQ